jgi:hypothetical protein
MKRVLRSRVSLVPPDRERRGASSHAARHMFIKQRVEDDDDASPLNFVRVCTPACTTSACGCRSPVAIGHIHNRTFIVLLLLLAVLSATLVGQHLRHLRHIGGAAS